MAIQEEPKWHKRVRGASALVWAAVAIVVSTASCSAQRERSAPNAAQGPVRVQVFDVYSGLALANTSVEVTSDNGIQCSVPPCPTGSRTWSGQTDGSGVLMIPPSALQFDTYVKTKDHRDARLAEEVLRESSRTHQVELYPEWLFDEQHDWTRGYKLVDARSGNVLADTLVRIEFPANDWPAQHGGISRLDVKTNPLGYVFFSFLRKPEPKQGQTLPSAPLADWVTPVASLIASGYRKAELNYFEGSDAERFTVRLER